MSRLAQHKVVVPRGPSQLDPPILFSIYDRLGWLVLVGNVLKTQPGDTKVLLADWKYKVWERENHPRFVGEDHDCGERVEGVHDVTLVRGGVGADSCRARKSAAGENTSRPCLT